MSVFNDIVEQIKSSLSQCATLADVKFIDADREEVVPNPIRNTYVSLGINSVSISEGAFGSYLGLSRVGEQYGNSSEIDIEMKIFSPRHSGGKQCYEIFSRIYEELLYHAANYNFKGVACKKARYNDELFSFELECHLRLSAYLGYETEDINISSIQIEKTTKG